MLIRPPGTTVPDGLLCFTADVFFFFFSPRVLRGPSTDRPETLPHGRNLAEFYNPTPKFGGRSPQKIWGQTCKISVNFGPLQILIANISGTARDIQNRPTLQTMAIPPAFNEKQFRELWSTNRLELHVRLDPLKVHFLAYYISALGGVLRPEIFTCARH